MDREAPGESFSSQNVKQTILKIRRGAGSGKIEILLSEGSSFFVTQRMVDENGLREGLSLTDPQVELLISRSNYIFAKRKALELLGSREHSVFQLKQKLLLRKFSLDIVETVLSELIGDGSVSNSRFMEIWLNNRLRKHPEGYSALYAGLVKAGIPSGEARDYLGVYMEDIDQEYLLETAAEKLLRKKDITRDKLQRFLLRRGFGNHLIIKYLDKNYPGDDDYDY